jgi:hypothetical protein
MRNVVAELVSPRNESNSAARRKQGKISRSLVLRDVVFSLFAAHVNKDEF